MSRGFQPGCTRSPAWRRGAEEWNQYAEETSKRGFFLTRECQQTYPPVGLIETDLGVQYGSERRIADLFNESKDRLTALIVDSYAVAAEE